MGRESWITPLPHTHRASAYVYLIPTLTLEYRLPARQQAVLCGHAEDECGEVTLSFSFRIV